MPYDHGFRRWDAYPGPPLTFLKPEKQSKKPSKSKKKGT